ncbi:MAG: VTT domain-containing protein [Litorimonas sp.]
MTLLSRDTVLFALASLGLGGLVFLFRDQAAGLIDLMGSYSGTPLAVGIAILVFLVGSVLFVPQWALIAASVAAFGLVEGTGIAWLATMVAATVHVFSARALEGRLRHRLEGDRAEWLRALFRRHSVHAGFIVRLVPTGPAILVNVAAGLFGVSRVGFLAGTAFGIVPKIVLTGAVVSELVSSARAQQLTLGLAILGFGVLLWAGIGRWRARRKVL